jgi:hypothetical protein
LEEDLEVVDTPRLSLLDQWVLVALGVLPEDLVGSVVGSEAGSMEAEDVVVSEAALIAEDMAADEVGLGTKEVEGLATEVNVVVMDHPTATLLPMHQLAQAAEAEEDLVAVVTAEVVEALVARIATDLGHQLVGMTLVEGAHMMTDPADIEATATAAMVIATEVHHVAAVAVTWSR